MGLHVCEGSNNPESGHVQLCVLDSGVELRIWLKQGKEKAQTRKGKKTAGKEKRLLARILEKARKRLSRQNSTKKCVNVRGEKASILQKGQLLQELCVEIESMLLGINWLNQY